MVLNVAGESFATWTQGSVDRDLRNIAGTFSLSYFDSGRVAQAINPDLDTSPPFQIIREGMTCTVTLDGVLVLKGYIDTVSISRSAEMLSATITGRDMTGDLVDCAAAPTGPVEWRGLNALSLAQKLAAPFGIAARADVPVGDPFPVFGIEVGETAMLAIERAARQRALLVVSDGVGGLLLTQGGASRAPGSLAVPGNVLHASYQSSWLQRFSDYYVKGQTNPRLARYGRKAGLTSSTNPTSAPGVPPAVSATVAEAATVQMTGHAIDPEIKRYRPTVRGVRTQSGSSSVQAQAEWALRVARGMGRTGHYTVLGWNVTPGGPIWLPNQLVRVSDPYADINRDMLIASVRYSMSNKGAMAVIGVAGRTAFDRIDEPAQSEGYIQKRAPKSFGPTRQG
jgi:prophage tail gpP-like protein